METVIYHWGICKMRHSWPVFIKHNRSMNSRAKCRIITVDKISFHFLNTLVTFTRCLIMSLTIARKPILYSVFFVNKMIKSHLDWSANKTYFLHLCLLSCAECGCWFESLWWSMTVKWLQYHLEVRLSQEFLDICQSMLKVTVGYLASITSC